MLVLLYFRNAPPCLVYLHVTSSLSKVILTKGRKVPILICQTKPKGVTTQMKALDKHIGGERVKLLTGVLCMYTRGLPHKVIT